MPTVYGQAHAPLGPHGEGFASVPSMQAWFASAPTAADPRSRIPRGDETPQVGDVVVFDWDKEGAADHTGIVTAVREDGSFDTAAPAPTTASPERTLTTRLREFFRPRRDQLWK